MTNPRMNERNRIWKRRVTAAGMAGFVALSALIGKQAGQSQTGIAAGGATAAQPSATTLNVADLATTASNASSATTSSSGAAATATTPSRTTASSSSLSAQVNTRTTASK